MLVGISHEVTFSDSMTEITYVLAVKGTLRRRIAYRPIFLVRLESIYYQIFFYSKIVPNCAVAK